MKSFIIIFTFTSLLISFGQTSFLEGPDPFKELGIPPFKLDDMKETKTKHLDTLDELPRFV
jgi:hypothetical protein